MNRSNDKDLPTPPELTETQRTHLRRMLGGERRFLAVMVIDLAVAVALTVYWTSSDSWSGARAVIILLILLSARAHLRQLRSAQLLRRYCGESEQ